MLPKNIAELFMAWPQEASPHQSGLEEITTRYSRPTDK
jgi:hypothetical protein